MELQNKYSNTSIYKIVSTDTKITECYVGSTIDFKRRATQHKYRCNNEKNKEYHKLVYQFIREHGGFDNFDIVLIPTKHFNNKLEAEQEERKYIEELKATLNCRVPSRTNKERVNTNRESIRLYTKIYNNEHREIQAIQHKAYYAIHKDRIHARKRELYILKKEQLRHSNENQDCHDISKNLTILVLIIIINLMHKHYINL